MPAAPVWILDKLLDHHGRWYGLGSLEKVEVHARRLHIAGNKIASFVAAQTGDRHARPTQPGQSHKDVAARAAGSREQVVKALHNIQRDKSAANDRSTLRCLFELNIDTTHGASHSPVSHMLVSMRSACKFRLEGP